MSFNPNDPGSVDSGLFGLPYNVEEADLVILPIPWEATVSYGSGTANGPFTVFEASKQVDLFHPLVKEVWKNKIAMASISEHLKNKSDEVRELVEETIELILEGKKADENTLQKVNAACQEMISSVEKMTSEHLALGKVVCGLGGDHSTPLGILKAYSKREIYGILQFDAHCDLRKAYEGFTYSHASVMYNVLEEIPTIQSLTQVGIRDYCEEEVAYIEQSNGRVIPFFDRTMQHQKMTGKTWHSICEEIVETLPAKVFISFDIDGLSPDHCPNTGTPVPGGLSFQEAVYLLEMVAQKRQIIGFDLNEVTPGDDEWDANVGARMLFQLCCAYYISKGK